MKGKIFKISSTFGIINYGDDLRITYVFKDYSSFKIGDIVKFDITSIVIPGTEHKINRAINLKLKETGSSNYIRLNKILRELDIPLITAINFFSDNNIEIEARPTTKISLEQSELIISHFIKQRFGDEIDFENPVDSIVEIGAEKEVEIIEIIPPSTLILDFFNGKKALLTIKNLAWDFPQAQEKFNSFKVGDRSKVVVLENEDKNLVTVSAKHLLPRPSENEHWVKLKVGERVTAKIVEVLNTKVLVKLDSGIYGTVNKNKEGNFLPGYEQEFILQSKDDSNQLLRLVYIEEDETEVSEEEDINKEDFQTQDPDLKSELTFRKSTYYTVANKEDRENILRLFSYDDKLYSSALSLDSILYLKFGFNSTAWENDFKNILINHVGLNATEKDALNFLENQKYWIRTNTRLDRNDNTLKHDWVLFNEETYLSGYVSIENEEYSFIITNLSLQRTKRRDSLEKGNSLNKGAFLLNSSIRVLSPFNSMPIASKQKDCFLKIQNKVLAFEILNKLKKEAGAILREEGHSIKIFDSFLEYQEAMERNGASDLRIAIDGSKFRSIPNSKTNYAIEINQDIDDLFSKNEDENQIICIRTREKSHKENKEDEYVWFSDAFIEAGNEKTKLHLINFDKSIDVLKNGFYIEPKVSLRQYQVQREVIKDFFDKKLKLDHIESLLLRPQKIKPPKEPQLEYVNKLLGETEKKQPKNNQVKAVKKAVGNENIFLIQGPPGTGKTTVIAEVVEQLVKKGERVLISSQTHIAVDNVLEKVSKNKKITCIRLGSKQRIKESLLPYHIDNLIENYSSDFEKLIDTNIQVVDALMEHDKDVSLEDVRNELKRIIKTKSIDYNESFRETLLHKNYEFLESISKTDWNNFNEVKELLAFWKESVVFEKEILIKPLLYKSVDVVFATCIGVRTDKELNDYKLKFNTVIIDEAGKANISESLAAISMAKKVILVGDQMQLPPYIDGSLLDEKEEGSFPRSKYGYKFTKEDIQHALKTSFFEFLVNRINNNKFPQDNKELLNYQHRMHPHIGEFISDSFYDGKVKMGEHTYENVLPMATPFDKEVVFINTSSAQNPYESFDGFSAKNESEAYCISKLIVPKLLDSGLSSEKFAIVAPYKTQVSLIRKSLKENIQNSHLIDVSTLDSFQGMEFDVIVFSFTRAASPDQKNKKVGFLDDARRLNVAFSRAKKKLILVGNAETLTDSRSHYDSLFNYTNLFYRLIGLSKKDKIGNFVELTDYTDLKTPFQTFMEKNKKGSIVQGVVKRIESYGAFVNLGSIDGLIYISDLSWNKVNDPNDVISLDDEVRVEILEYDKEKEYIKLGLKQTQPHPWDNLTLKKGDRLIGKIENVADYGLFIELNPGITGLLHISKMPQRLRNSFKKDYKKGSLISVTINSINEQKRQIDLKTA